jgi:hypothetical protein
VGEVAPLDHVARVAACGPRQALVHAQRRAAVVGALLVDQAQRSIHDALELGLRRVDVRSGAHL